MPSHLQGPPASVHQIERSGHLGELLQIQERVRAAESGYLQAQVQYSLADNALLRAIARLDSIANQRTPAILQR